MSQDVPKFADGAWIECAACHRRHPIVFEGPRTLNAELAIVCLCGSVLAYLSHEIRDGLVRVDFDFYKFNGDVARKGIAENVNKERSN